MKIAPDVLRIFIVILLLVSSEQAKTNDIKKCPSYCTCDLFEDLNRADCSDQRLISANVEVPYAAELLDLSYNDITTIDNSCFEGLVYVINLTIAHNALHTIYLDAFSPLKKVKSIDLSFNRLEYFDERIFETNTKLTRIDLSGNKFMSLQNKPFIKSTSLRHLDLHDAQITYIYPLMFREVPRLRDLDISNNLMITLNTVAFDSLHQLETLNLEENRWVCDKSLDGTLDSLKKRGVETRLSSCPKTNVIRGRGPAFHMFERMMEAPPLSSFETEEATSVEDAWKPKENETIDDFICGDANPDEKCQLLNNCLAKLNVLVKEKEIGSAQFRCQYTENDVFFVLFMGILIGISLVTCVVSCAISIKNFCKSKKAISHRRSETPPPCVSGTFRTMPAVPAQRPIPPPVPLRQRRSNRRSRNAPSGNLTLSNTRRTAVGSQSGFANFLTQIFERPSRHQYYRTINENTAHMIRRLSQSNLFNNRLSQHFTGARNNEGDHDSAQQVEPLLQSQAAETSHRDVEMSTSDTPQVHCSPRERWQTAFQQRAPSAPQKRPETPPPSYGDVIDVKRAV